MDSCPELDYVPLTTGSVSQVATMQSVIQRYQAGETNIKGRKGPSMNILPKKLPKNSASAKYIPFHDTMALKNRVGITLERQTESNYAILQVCKPSLRLYSSFLTQLTTQDKSKHNQNVLLPQQQ